MGVSEQLWARSQWVGGGGAVRFGVRGRDMGCGGAGGARAHHFAHLESSFT